MLFSSKSKKQWPLFCQRWSSIDVSNAVAGIGLMTGAVSSTCLCVRVLSDSCSALSFVFLVLDAVHTLLKCIPIISSPSRPPLANPLRNPIPISVRPYSLALSVTLSAFVRTVKPGELTPGIPATEYERRRRQLVDGLPHGSLVVCVAGQVKYMSAGESVLTSPFHEPLSHMRTRKLSCE